MELIETHFQKLLSRELSEESSSHVLFLAFLIGFVVQGHENLKPGAFARLTLHIDRATVIFNDAVRSRQTETCAAVTLG